MSEKLLAFALTLAMVFIPAFSGYKIGRLLERRALTTYLYKSMQAECEDCKTIGYKDGYKAMDKECERELYEAERR